jgi:hypothetical protein
LAFACFITMIVVPVMYAMFFGVRETVESVTDSR